MEEQVEKESPGFMVYRIYEGGELIKRICMSLPDEGCNPSKMLKPGQRLEVEYSDTRLEVMPEQKIRNVQPEIWAFVRKVSAFMYERLVENEWKGVEWAVADIDSLRAGANEAIKDFAAYYNTGMGIGGGYQRAADVCNYFFMLCEHRENEEESGPVDVRFPTRFDKLTDKTDDYRSNQRIWSREAEKSFLCLYRLKPNDFGSMLREYVAKMDPELFTEFVLSLPDHPTATRFMTMRKEGLKKKKEQQQ